MDFVAMTPDMTRQLNHIAEQYRKPYTEFIDELSDIYDDETGFWWDTPLVSRNAYLCECFLHICILRLIIDEVSHKKPDKIFVANDALQQAVLDNIKGIAVRIGNGHRGIKAFLKQNHWIRSEYEFYHFQKYIRILRGFRQSESLTDFQGREIVLVGTYRISAETRNGILQDRYFPGLIENSDKDVVFLSMFSGARNTEKTLFDVIHGRKDHICIEDWVTDRDFREIRSYIRWCRSIKIQPCHFDGMDVTALVERALRVGGWDNNVMLGIARGTALCRMVEQWGLKIKSLIDWYEGQPSSNAMIRRFRAKYPDVPTVACSPFPYEENLLSLFPSERQIERKVVPEYFSVMGQAWERQICQFSNKVKCVTVPSFRHQDVWDDAIETSTERKGLLVVLSLFEDCSAQLLAALGAAINGMDSASIGPIYIKNHPVHQAHRISDYGVEESLFQGWEVIYLFSDIHEALCGKKVVVLTKTTSTLEVMLSGTYVINFIPRGDLSMVSLPEEARKKITIVYSAEELRDCLQATPERLSAAEVEELREVSFTRVNRETINVFLDCSCMI